MTRAARWTALAAGAAAAAAGLAPVAASAETVPATSWAASADTFVNAFKPSTSYGSANYISADGPAERVSFLRFTVTGAPAGPQHTVLRIRQSTANSSEPSCDDITDCWHYVRVSVRAVGPGGWDESTTYATAPAPGEVLGAVPSGKVRGYHSWIDIDLGAFVNGDGTYDVALTSDTTTNYTFASRESLSPAQLVLAP